VNLIKNSFIIKKIVLIIITLITFTIAIKKINSDKVIGQYHNYKVKSIIFQAKDRFIKKKSNYFYSFEIETYLLIFCHKLNSTITLNYTYKFAKRN
jgi:hypothetical protein